MVIIKNYKVKKLFNKFPEISGKIGIMHLQLLAEADQQLFNKLCNISDHCLHSLLPPLSTASQHYHLRQRAHN